MGQSAGNFIYISMHLYCAPRKKLAVEIVENLRVANAKRKKNDFYWYKNQLSTIFQIPKSYFENPLTVEEKVFFAGFLFGEGSINVSAKKEKSAPFGIILDPEFSVTQHVNAVSQLFRGFRIFNTGSLRYKVGSNATLVYRIDNRTTLLEKVIPFYETYAKPFSTFDLEFQNRLESFKELLRSFQGKKHLEYSTFSDKMLPIWDRMRKQRFQSNSSFASLQDAQAYVKEIMHSKKESSETTRDLV